MFPKQRREKILEILDSAGHVTVEELSVLFGVSLDSIRKDLKALADAGKCRREYGGAFRVGEPSRPATPVPAESPALANLNDDTLLGNENRMAVARRAYMEINDGDTIFVMATGEVEAQVDVVGVLATRALERAIADGARSATAAYGLPAARDLA